MNIGKNSRIASFWLVVSIVVVAAVFAPNRNSVAQQSRIEGTGLLDLQQKTATPIVEVFSTMNGVLIKKWNGVKNVKVTDDLTTFLNIDGQKISVHGDGVIVIVTDSPY